MVEMIKLAALKPAAYNPREIGRQQFEDLKASLELIGCVLPVIVNKSNNVIIAGHQRCRALSAIGATDVPAVFVEGITIADEMTFNQLHNGTEQRASGVWSYTGNSPTGSFCELDNSDFEIRGVSRVALKEICRLLTRYGNVLSCVICGGRVYIGGAYVRACQLLGSRVNAYICAPSMSHHLDVYFSKHYGEYNYDHIERKTYIQGLAQLHRNVKMKPGIKKLYASKTYCEGVIPYLQGKSRTLSILDFGCGKGAYIQSLKAEGYGAIGIEFYNNNTVSIDIAKGNQQIDALIWHLKTRGRFDIVVCDSVLNSVDSMDAELSVLRCLNAFCKPNGALFISGRPIKDAHGHNMQHISSESKNFITFLDRDGFTAHFRRGNWYFQKYHSRETFEASLSTASLRANKIVDNKSSFWAQCSKTGEIENAAIRAAIDFEFNLPLPGGRSYNRNKEMFQALMEVL